MYLLLKTVVFHCSCWLTRGYTLFKNPSFWLHCHPLHFKGCMSFSQTYVNLRVWELPSFESQIWVHSLRPEDPEKEQKIMIQLVPSETHGGCVFFSCFKGFMIHEGKEWMASHLWTDICPYVCFENLVIWDPQIRPKNGSIYIRVKKKKNISNWRLTHV